MVLLAGHHMPFVLRRRHEQSPSISQSISIGQEILPTISSSVGGGILLSFSSSPSSETSPAIALLRGFLECKSAVEDREAVAALSGFYSESPKYRQ